MKILGVNHHLVADILRLTADTAVISWQLNTIQIQKLLEKHYYSRPHCKLYLQLRMTNEWSKNEWNFKRPNFGSSRKEYSLSLVFSLMQILPAKQLFDKLIWPKALEMPNGIILRVFFFLFQLAMNQSHLWMLRAALKVNHHI